jgi:hypothetical protein
MRTTRILLAAGCVGAIALGTLVPAKAQYYYPRPPDYGFASPPPDTRYGYGWTWNDCPPGWTVQGGTACPTDGALGAVLAESGGGPLMQHGAEKHRGDCFAIFTAIRRASSFAESFAAEHSRRWVKRPTLG